MGTVVRKSCWAGVAAAVVFSVAGVRAEPSREQWTIVLLTFDGPGHPKAAKKARDYVAKSMSLKSDDFIVIHDENQSAIYYGRYNAVDRSSDPAEAKRATDDLKRFQQFRLDDANPFQGAVLMLLPTPDPEAPKEWNLRNAEGVYSLEVAAYRDHPDRKQAAVDSVREARKMGLPAYYFHGKTTSSVLLGAFPKDAVQELTPDFKAKPGEELVVVPFKPANMPDVVPQADGTQSRVMAPKFVIVDPILKDLMQRFPEHAVNGETMERQVKDPATGKTTVQRADSFLVDIREIRKDSLLSAGDRVERGGAPDSPPAAAVTPRQSTSGTGKLKSIGN